MEALRLKEFVTEKGIYLNHEKLLLFKNQKVEIIILPINDEQESNNNFMRFAGTLSTSDAEKMLESLNECRSVVYE